MYNTSQLCSKYVSILCNKCFIKSKWNISTDQELIYVHISAGTLLQIYRRLIGRSYIALARQDQYIGNILDPLGRLLIILVFVADLEHKLWAILNFQAGNFPVVITLLIRKRA